MFHAFLLQTEYFVSTNFYPESGSRAASLASVRIQKKYLPYRPFSSDSAGRRFFEWSVGSCLKQSKPPKGVKRRLIKTSGGATIIFW